IDDREPGLGIALEIVEPRGFLQLLLDAVGHLLHHVGRGRAGPGRLDQHGIDRELRIFLAPEVEIGADTCHGADAHEEDHERTMPERPIGYVETGHWAISVGSETFWPSASQLTPAVTTRSPSLSPLERVTVSVSKRSTLTGRRCTTFSVGDTTHTAGSLPDCSSAPVGMTATGSPFTSAVPTTTAPSRMASGALGRETFTV